MDGGIFLYALLLILAIGLLHAAYTDLKRREIENWLNAGIALAAPIFWWAAGYALWPDMALQIAVALAVFTVFAVLNAFGMMGGGDVKLLAALALWFPWNATIYLIVIMSLVGGALTLGYVITHKLRRTGTIPEIPYGVAIACAGLWVIGERYFNHFI